MSRIIASVTMASETSGSSSYHPSIHPNTPQRWRWYQALQAHLKATDATLEERGQAAQQVARLGG
jgi:hypothetical protein